MPIFSAIATALFAGTALAGTFAVSATAFALSAATSIGLSYAIRALSGTTQQQAPAADRGVGGVQGTLQAAGDISRSFPLGYSVTAGSLVYANTWGNVNDTPNAYFTQVIALSDLPLPSAPLAIYANGETITLLTGEPDANAGWPVQEYRKDSKDHLWVKFYDGTQTTADSFLNNFVANADRPWGVTRVGKGISYVIVTALVEDTLFTGFPAFRFALPGINLYDPSKDSTVGGSGSQRWSDRTTWGGDGNNFPAVQLYNVLRGISYNGSWVYGLQNAPVAALSIVSWINAINDCRSTVIGESGNEPQYRAGLECKVEALIADTVELLLTACQGRLSEIGGVYKINVGEPGAPVASFTDDAIISTQEQTFTPFFELAKTVTGVGATYPEPAESWQTKDAPPLRDATLETAAGNRRLLADIRFDCVPYAAQVQRLMKSALREAQRARRHTIVLPPEFWVLEPGDIVSWYSVRNSYLDDGKLFRVDGIVDRDDMNIMVDITEVDPSDYHYDFSTEFTPVTRGPIVVTRPNPQGVIDWFAEGVIIYDAAGVGRRPAIRLAWDGSVVADIEAVQFEVRNNFGSNDIIHRGRSENVAAGAVLISQSLLSNTTYGARGRYVPHNARDTLWSDWINVTTPDVNTGLVEFTAEVKYQVTVALNRLSDNIKNLKAERDKYLKGEIARNWLDKKEVRTQLVATYQSALASIEEVRIAYVAADAALAQLIVTVRAELADAVAEIVTTTTALSTLTAAFAAYQISITAKFQDVTSLINLESIARSTADSAFAATLQQHETTLNGHTANLSFLQGSYNGISVQFGVLGTIDGVTGGFVFDGVRRLDGSVAFQLAIRGDVIIDGSLSAIKIQAGSINTRELSVNGVALENIIAGAVSNTFSFSGGDLSVGNYRLWNTIAVSGNRFFAGGRIEVKALCGYVDGYMTKLITPRIGPTTYPQVVGAAVVKATWFRIIVDGTVVAQRRFANMTYIAGVDGVAPVYWPQSGSQTLLTELALTQGVHAVTVQVMREDDGAELGVPSTIYCQAVVTELRR